MTGEIEAAGDIVAGGLLASAVERHGTAGGHASSQVCLNCGTGLQGDYCHRCGQPGHLHRSLGAIWHDLLHGVLHLEGKTWRTLPMLAVKPGELTRRYIHGERARFVSPMALFLFSVFLMFAVISAVGVSLAMPEDARQQLGGELAEARADLAKLDEQRRAAIAAGKSTRAIDVRRADVKMAEQAIEAMQAGKMPVAISGRFAEVRTGWATLDKGIAKANKNPDLALYKVQNSAYKFSWALIPISVPFLWLMFAWWRQYRLYDHAIFVIYSLSFMTLLAVVLTIGGKLGLPGAIIGPAAILVPPVHMYRQLRGAYRLRRWKALLRMIALLTFASVAATIFVLLLLALGMMG